MSHSDVCPRCESGEWSFHSDVKGKSSVLVQCDYCELMYGRVDVDPNDYTDP